MLAVTTTPTSTRLTALATVKAEIGLLATADDAVLTTLIDQASAQVAAFVNRTLAVASYSERFDFRRPVANLMLARWPVVEVTSVTVDGTALTSAEWIIEDAGCLTRQDDDGDLQDWLGRVVVAYRAGYTLPGAAARNLPHDIERAAIMLVVSAYQGRGRDPAVRSETVEGCGETTWFPDGIPPTIAAILEPHRQVSMG